MTQICPPAQTALDPLLWPRSRLAEAIEAVAMRAGLAQPGNADTPEPPPDQSSADAEDIAGWFEWACERLGIEALPVESAVADLDAFLRGGGPAIVFLPRDAAGRFFVLATGRGRSPRLLAPDQTLQSCRTDVLRAALCGHLERPLVPEAERVLDVAKIAGPRRPRVLKALLAERLAGERIEGLWLLRLPASAPFWRQLLEAGVQWKLAAVFGIFAVLYGLEIVAWRLIGAAALDGRFDFGWLTAWVLILLTMIPWRLFGGWLEAMFALDTGRVLKSRLLAGALRLAPDKVKTGGLGHLLGRVMESQALEALALSGGMTVLVSGLELVFAAGILSQGAAGAWHLPLLVIWCGFGLWLARRYHARLRAWSMQRLRMTNDLIEAMVGHRTRLAQEIPARRDANEDAMLVAYLGASQALDTGALQVTALLPSGWLMVGLTAMIPAFVSGQTPAALAISLGGLFVAQRAFAGISSGLAGLSRAAIAWGQVAELFEAGHERAADRPFLPPSRLADAPLGGRLIEATALQFQHSRQGDVLIQDANFAIGQGDRILLQGPSGSGKSTLAALLTGLRQPTGGRLLLNGLDRQTLGANWHRIATAAPQFHENHILSGSLAYNLLLGRTWPASSADLAEAEVLCSELGLSELVSRMPGGLNQRVGETGWQLSHGERSRIFLARALLQDAQLTIMDESFAALDPETLDKCLQTALKRARTLIVIAHP